MLNSALRQTTGADHSTGYPPAPYAWYVVVLLTLAYVISFVDRQILALLVVPIQRDLALSDTQMSLLLGPAFAVFFAVFGIPAGRLADRGNRRTIIAVGITLWCLMTTLCGLARTYLQLFVTRIGVGVGEATLGPCALSLITDYFPLQRRTRALGFYAMGVSVGAALALLVGGRVVNWVYAAPPLELPLIGAIHAWQAVFLLVGMPGLLLALLMLTVKEPARRERLQAGGADVAGVSLRTALDFVLERRQAYGGLFLAMSGATTLGYGFLSWLPTLFVRSWDWTIPQIAAAQGMAMLIAGPLSANGAGWLADRLFATGRRDAHLVIFLWGALLMLVSGVALPLVPDPWLAVAMLGVNVLGSAGLTAVAMAALLVITPNELRGQVSALFYLVINLCGMSLGPTAVALLAEYVFAGPASIGPAMAAVALVAGLVCSVAAWVSTPAYAARVTETAEWRTDQPVVKC